MTKILREKEIKQLIPHRYENLLIDEVVINGETGEGSLKVCVSEKDKWGREIFLKEKKPGLSILTIPAIMEILALGSILSSGGVPEGYLAFYVTINDFEFHHNLRAGETATGSVSKLRTKANFRRYTGTLYNAEGETIASGDMMAFAGKQDEEAIEPEGKPGVIPPPTSTEPVILNNNARHPLMTVFDGIHSFNGPALEICTRYQYPADHPFVKGHFPGKPVMMGIMLWMGIGEAMLVLAAKLGKKGELTLTADAEIIKSNGTIVADAKDVVSRIYLSAPPYHDQSEIISTKKLYFRGTVLPGETIYIKLFNVRIE